ncbi:Phasin [Rhodoplanes elegans]|uniref:Phasin n=1 Tax=Rhodoplanes elegans TaxID=29408 RepID=A0A327JTW8_9BRAD|nr:phasin family protein [Rhodoplanes elegans]MBK5957822.1 Phasin [Rhodoplanes elegans]RAI28893.1 Phasin [Rhodoplanes elegans]
MNIRLDTMQGFNKDGLDATMKSFGAVSQSVQAIAAEAVDYSKKSFEQGTQVLEKILGAKSLDTALELQSDYLKASYESFIAQSNRMSELYADLAKEIYKPFEGFVGKMPTVPFAGQQASS